MKFWTSKNPKEYGCYAETDTKVTYAPKPPILAINYPKLRTPEPPNQITLCDAVSHSQISASKGKSLAKNWSKKKQNQKTKVIRGLMYILYSISTSG